MGRSVLLHLQSKRCDLSVLPNSLCTEASAARPVLLFMNVQTFGSEANMHAYRSLREGPLHIGMAVQRHRPAKFPQAG